MGLRTLVIGGLAVAVSFCGAPSSAFADPPPTPGASLGVASIPNLRDVGGYTTRDGAIVRRGLAFRSAQLNPIGPDDLKKLAALGLRKDFDLRTVDEREQKPDQLPPGVENVWLNVLADASGTTDAAEFGRLLSDPKAANEALGGGKVEEMFRKGYRQFVDLPSAKRAYRQLFTELGDPDSLPALYHCTGGKDRTGWASALLLTLLGVPEEQVIADFLRSNDYVLPSYRPMIERFTKAGGDPAIPLAILGVKAEYLEASLDEMRARYGSIEGYFSNGLGIDKAGQQRLRERFLGDK